MVECEDCKKHFHATCSEPVQSHGNKLHRTEQSGEASSEEVLVNMRQKKKKNQRSRAGMHTAQRQSQGITTSLSCPALTSVFPSAKDSLGL